MSDNRIVVSTGYGIGSFLAGLMSWIVNKSFVWAIIHFLFGWFYVFYACCAHTSAIDNAARSVISNTNDATITNVEKNE